MPKLLQAGDAASEPTESLPPPLLVDASRFCRELGVARRTFDRYVSTGQIPGPDVSLSAKIKRWKWATVVATVERMSAVVE